MGGKHLSLPGNADACFFLLKLVDQNADDDVLSSRPPTPPPEYVEKSMEVPSERSPSMSGFPKPTERKAHFENDNHTYLLGVTDCWRERCATAVAATSRVISSSTDGLCSPRFCTQSPPGPSTESMHPIPSDASISYRRTRTRPTFRYKGPAKSYSQPC